MAKFGVLLRWFEHSQIYHPTAEMEATGAELGRLFENIFFKSTDGIDLNGWFYPASPKSSRAHIAILYCHGNGGNISHRLAVYRVLLQMGVNVFTFDYRGYGRSKGRLSEEGTYLDGQAAYQWLRQKGFQADNIIAFGESLGGAIATEICVREKTGGLILQSAFSCIADIGKELFPWLPVALISSVRYDTCRKLPGLKIPVLVMHSREDELIRVHHGEKNFAAANDPKLFWEFPGEHNDPLKDCGRFAEGIERFLALIEKRPQKTADKAAE